MGVLLVPRVPLQCRNQKKTSQEYLPQEYWSHNKKSTTRTLPLSHFNASCLRAWSFGYCLFLTFLTVRAAAAASQVIGGRHDASQIVAQSLGCSSRHTHSRSESRAGNRQCGTTKSDVTRAFRFAIRVSNVSQHNTARQPVRRPGPCHVRPLGADAEN